MGIKCKIKGTAELQKELIDKQKKMNIFFNQLAKEIALRLLRKVKKRTPVGVYKDKQVNFTTKEGKEVSFFAKSNGKVGGNLRNGWQVGDITEENGVYTVVVYNPVFYAPYVEYGHRTRNGGWVEGRFMLTISENELNDNIEKLVKKKLVEFLGSKKC